eukprot:7361341-Alexandrium_andersonii.AAC.1
MGPREGLESTRLGKPQLSVPDPGSFRTKCGGPRLGPTVGGPPFPPTLRESSACPERGAPRVA